MSAALLELTKKVTEVAEELDGLAGDVSMGWPRDPEGREQLRDELLALARKLR